MVKKACEVGEARSFWQYITKAIGEMDLENEIFQEEEETLYKEKKEESYFIGTSLFRARLIRFKYIHH